MAPEVALNKPYNASVDIFSFGMIIYETVTGCAPFKGMKLAEFVNKVVRGHKQLNFEYDDYGRKVNMDVALETLVQACISHDIATRPSAEHCLSVVSELLDKKLAISTQSGKTLQGKIIKSMSGVFSRGNSI